MGEKVTPETKVAKEITGWLRGEGWRCLRMQSGRYRGRARSFVQVGEIGMPDWLCVRYRPGLALFWLEVKRRGGEASTAQRMWIKAEEERGAVVVVADSLDEFRKWYREVYG